METKNFGILESKAGIEGGSAAATRPSTPLSLSARLCGPEPGDSLFMRGKGGAAGGESTRTQLHKGTVTQLSGAEGHAYACSLTACSPPE